MLRCASLPGPTQIIINIGDAFQGPPRSRSGWHGRGGVRFDYVQEDEMEPELLID